MFKILIVNQGHTDNLGDQAIMFCMGMALKDIAEINFMPFVSFEKETSIHQQKEYKQSKHIYNKIKNKVIRLMAQILKDNFIKLRLWLNIQYKLKSKDYNLVIIGGGELIKTQHIFCQALDIWIKFINYKLKCPIIIWGISCDEYFKKEEVEQYTESLNQCLCISARDKNSCKIIENMFGIECLYCPDAAFLYKRFSDINISNKQYNTLVVMIFHYDTYANFNDTITKNQYYELWLNIITEHDQDIDNVYLAYTTFDDYKETLEFEIYLKEKYKKKISVVSTDTIDQLISLFALSKRVISGRMHALILALQYNNEIVPFNLKKKLEVFQREWLERPFDYDCVVREISSKFDNIKKFII